MNPESPRNGQTFAMSEDSANISISARPMSVVSAALAYSGRVITGLRSGLVISKIPHYEILGCCLFASVCARHNKPVNRTKFVPILGLPIVRPRFNPSGLGHAVDALIGAIGFEVFKFLGHPRRHLGETLDLIPGRWVFLPTGVNPCLKIGRSLGAVFAEARVAGFNSGARLIDILGALGEDFFRVCLENLAKLFAGPARL